MQTDESADGQHERWIRFPLALLAYKPRCPSLTLDTLLAFAAWRVGDSQTATEISPHQIALWARGSSWTYQPADEDHLRLMRGAKIIGFRGGPSCEFMLQQVREAVLYLESDKTSAVRNEVNLRLDLFTRARVTARNEAGTGPFSKQLSFRELRVLCAILSKIGKTKIDRLGWQEIQARAAGWAGKAEMLRATKAEHKRRKAIILTKDQVQKTRDDLEAGGWFVRLKFAKPKGGKCNGGESWFSFSTDEKGDRGRAQLAAWVMERKGFCRNFRTEAREADAREIEKATPIGEGETNEFTEKSLNPTRNPSLNPTLNINDRSSLTREASNEKSNDWSKASPSNDGVRGSSFEPTWKPVKGTKVEQLRTIPSPESDEYPSEREFDGFIEDFCPKIATVGRGEALYEQLCFEKWHVWNGRKWKRIISWQAYVAGLESKMQSDETGQPREKIDWRSDEDGERIPF